MSSAATGPQRLGRLPHLTLRCGDHPRYQGQVKPRSNCEACGLLYRSHVLITDLESDGDDLHVDYVIRGTS